jgi:hypothetical protein
LLPARFGSGSTIGQINGTALERRQQHRDVGHRGDQGGSGAESHRHAGGSERRGLFVPTIFVAVAEEERFSQRHRDPWNENVGADAIKAHRTPQRCQKAHDVNGVCLRHSCVIRSMTALTANIQIMLIIVVGRWRSTGAVGDLIYTPFDVETSPLRPDANNGQTRFWVQPNAPYVILARPAVPRPAVRPRILRVTIVWPWAAGRGCRLCDVTLLRVSLVVARGVRGCQPASRAAARAPPHVHGAACDGSAGLYGVFDHYLAADLPGYHLLHVSLACTAGVSRSGQWPFHHPRDSRSSRTSVEARPSGEEPLMGLEAVARVSAQRSSRAGSGLANDTSSPLPNSVVQPGLDASIG